MGLDSASVFGGSVTMIIACEQPGRKAFLMEIALLYCDAIVQRWEKFMGPKAAMSLRVIGEDLSGGA